MEPASLDSCDTTSVVEWLMDGARSAPESGQFVAELCNRLLACGIPLWRVAVFVRTLHPNVLGRRFLWLAGADVETLAAPFDIAETAEFRNDALTHVCRTGCTLRRRLADADCPIDFPLLADLRTEQVSDYLGTPLFFTNGSIHGATWTTRRPGGFSAAQIAGLQAVLASLARVAEVRALRREAANLLDAYVGHGAGERILNGQIRRGDTEEVHAAIWLSDMRGFTASADRLPLRELIDLLNRYFDCQVPLILDAGGEVLKFMGDGLLAIFPFAAKDGADSVCRRAFSAALAARERISRMTAPPGYAGGDGVHFGVALHVGQILYGNIGGGNRLDFTCIGPAVNLAARLEKLAARLRRAIIASSDFALHCPDGLLPLGEFELAGFSAAQTIFGVEESDAGNP